MSRTIEDINSELNRIQHASNCRCSLCGPLYEEKHILYGKKDKYYTLNCQLCNAPITQCGPKPGVTVCKECLHPSLEVEAETQQTQSQELFITFDIGSSTLDFLRQVLSLAYPKK